MSFPAPVSFPTRLARFVAARRIAPGGAAGPLADARAVLVVKLDALGDFVLATPFLRALRRAAPRARITLLTRRLAAGLAENCPHVDAVHVLELDETPRRFGALRRVNALARFFRTTLGGARFDWAFIPRTGPDHHQARLVARLSGAPRRLGFATPPPDAIAGPAALTTEVAYPAAPLNEAEANLLLLRAADASVEAAGPLELHCPPAEEDALRQRLAAAGITAEAPLLALGVGASLPHKLWPAEHFLLLAREWRARHGGPVVLLGDRQDAARFPGDEPGIVNLAGELSPAQSTALLRRARLFVGNDSGAVHLAAAAGCPVVVVHWDREDSPALDVNSHRRFSPHGVPFRLVHPRSPGGERDARLVQPAAVIAACESLLADPAVRAHA